MYGGLEVHLRMLRMGQKRGSMKLRHCTFMLKTPVESLSQSEAKISALLPRYKHQHSNLGPVYIAKQVTSAHI
jgi:hypothetical protein